MKQHDKDTVWTCKLDHDSHGSLKGFQRNLIAYLISTTMWVPKHNGKLLSASFQQQGLHSESSILVTGFCLLFSLKSICKVSRWCWVTRPVLQLTFLFKQTVLDGVEVRFLCRLVYFIQHQIMENQYSQGSLCAQGNDDVETRLPHYCLSLYAVSLRLWPWKTNPNQKQARFVEKEVNHWKETAGGREDSQVRGVSESVVTDVWV